jgi:hypothetical protein
MHSDLGGMFDEFEDAGRIRSFISSNHRIPDGGIPC